jgi:ArsR family transcriptional regulator, arsenate/arsenite/antimonite-responsive transcriptional repressor / arsenate reductase (thioredoxin)
MPGRCKKAIEVRRRENREHQSRRRRSLAAVATLIVQATPVGLTPANTSATIEAVVVEGIADLEARAAVHAALGDPHRLAIVEQLAVSDRAPSELGEWLGIESNLLAHHLRVLEGVGLVERVVSDGDRRRRYLRLRSQHVVPFVGPAPVEARTVVFVCTHNSARSQLAAALWNTAHPVGAASAGTHPAAQVHPYAVAAGAAAGVDLRRAVPRSLDDLEAEPDLVITVCDRAHEELSALRWRELHWSVPDPAADGRRTVFDATVRRLLDRIARLGPSVVPAGG